MVGRPKLSDLSCAICDMTFKRKNLLEEHMKIHSPIPNQSKQTRTRSNWCHTCRKGFDDDEYKTHIQTEHVLDVPKVDFKCLNDDLFSFESGYVVLSKRKIKKEDEFIVEEESVVENENDHLNIFIPEIKIEPAEENFPEISSSEENAIPAKSRTLASKLKIRKIKIPTTTKIKCKICGMKFKGERGLKIHMSAHKRSRKTSEDVSQTEDNVDKAKQSRKVRKHKKVNSSINNDANSFVLSNNNIANVGQNQPANVVLNVPQLQNQSSNPLLNLGYNNMLNFVNQPSNILNVANQSNNILSTGNSSDLQVVPDSNAQNIENIPKFECSEKYMKWLKKFIYKCKVHKYPLDRALCLKIGRIADEITNALANPDGLLKKKSNHFYFTRMLKSMSEVIVGHMRHSLCVVTR